MAQIPKLDKKGLRNFGLLTGTIIAVLFGLLLPWLRSYSPPRWIWVVSGVMWSWSFLAPATLNPVYQIWMRIGLIIGWVESRIILSLVFYGLVVPMGILMRLGAKDPMNSKFNTHLKSYRLKSRILPKNRMEKPF